MYSMVSGYQEKVQLRGIFPPQLHLAVVSTEGKKRLPRRDSTRRVRYLLIPPRTVCLAYTRWHVLCEPALPTPSSAVVVVVVFGPLI